jgi:nucleotidyltransferase substrate binding protein (TIGR01987 family)
MALDLSSLRKAITAFGALQARTSDMAWMASLDDVLRFGLKAGVIQHFEFTYELCWKFIQRWLRDNAVAADADHPRTRKDLFRQAARFGIIGDPTPWFAYGDARNLTSHAYDEVKVDVIHQLTGQFLTDAQALLAALEAAND